MKGADNFRKCALLTVIGGTAALAAIFPGGEGAVVTWADGETKIIPAPHASLLALRNPGYWRDYDAERFIATSTGTTTAVIAAFGKPT